MVVGSSGVLQGKRFALAHPSAAGNHCAGCRPPEDPTNWFDTNLVLAGPFPPISDAALPSSCPHNTSPLPVSSYEICTPREEITRYAVEHESETHTEKSDPMASHREREARPPHAAQALKQK